MKTIHYLLQLFSCLSQIVNFSPWGIVLHIRFLWSDNNQFLRVERTQTLPIPGIYFRFRVRLLKK